MSLDLIIAIAVACFVAGLFVGIFRGWNACDKKWFSAARHGNVIEGPKDENDIVPGYRVMRVDMTPIEFMPSKCCGYSEADIESEATGE